MYSCVGPCVAVERLTNGPPLMRGFFSWPSTAFGLCFDLTQLRYMYISCLRSFRTRFDSLKGTGDLQVYQGFMMPLNHQAGIPGTLKQYLRSESTEL